MDRDDIDARLMASIKTGESADDEPRVPLGGEMVRKSVADEIIAGIRPALRTEAKPTPKAAPEPVSEPAWITPVFKAIAQFVVKRVHDVRQEAILDLEICKSLAKRVDELEQSRPMTFQGPHDPSKKYPAGAVVQRSGSTWVALILTTDKPRRLERLAPH